jgi:hypothetical protein
MAIISYCQAMHCHSAWNVKCEFLIVSFTMTFYNLALRLTFPCSPIAQPMASESALLSFLHCCMLYCWHSPPWSYFCHSSSCYRSLVTWNSLVRRMGCLCKRWAGRQGGSVTVRSKARVVVRIFGMKKKFLQKHSEVIDKGFDTLAPRGVNQEILGTSFH